MAVTFGFYNSKNGDRVYNAEQMSSIFSGIIREGILPFAHSDPYSPDPEEGTDSLYIRASESGMKIIVGKGRAWLNNTWTDNSSDLEVYFDPANPQQDRIDAVVIEVNKTDHVDTSVTPNVPDRANGIVVVKGELSDNPQRPTLQHDRNAISQYVLAYVTIRHGATSILETDIYRAVPEITPYVSGPLRTISTASVLSNWNNAFDQAITDFQQNADAEIDQAIMDYFGEGGSAEGELYNPFILTIRRMGHPEHHDNIDFDPGYTIDRYRSTSYKYADLHQAIIDNRPIKAVYWDYQTISDSHQTIRKIDFYDLYLMHKDQRNSSNPDYDPYDNGERTYITFIGITGHNLKIFKLKANTFEEGEAVLSVDEVFDYDQQTDLIVTFTNNNGSLSCDKTFTEIINAYFEGRNIQGIFIVSNSETISLDTFRIYFSTNSSEGRTASNATNCYFTGAKRNRRQGDGIISASVGDTNYYITYPRNDSPTYTTDVTYRELNPNRYKRVLFFVDVEYNNISTVGFNASPTLDLPMVLSAISYGSTPAVFLCKDGSKIYSSTDYEIIEDEGVYNIYVNFFAPDEDADYQLYLMRIIIGPAGIFISRIESELSIGGLNLKAPFALGNDADNIRISANPLTAGSSIDFHGERTSTVELTNISNPTGNSSAATKEYVDHFLMDLPNTPEQDGTYELKLSITNGVKTLTWADRRT